MGDATLTPNTEPLKYSLDFELYLQAQFNDWAGMRSELKRLDNGQYVVEYEQDASASPICNGEGGKHLVKNLRMVMNRHCAFGSLSRDEIAEITGDIIKATIDPMFIWTEKFGVTSLSILENAGLNLFESIYTYMTSLKETVKGGQGGIMSFGTAISVVQYIQKDAAPAAQKGLY